MEGSAALLFGWRSVVLHFWSHSSLNELKSTVKFIKPHLLEWKLEASCCEDNVLDAAFQHKCPTEGKCSEEHCSRQVYHTFHLDQSVSSPSEQDIINLLSYPLLLCLFLTRFNLLKIRWLLNLYLGQTGCLVAQQSPPKITAHHSEPGETKWRKVGSWF